MLKLKRPKGLWIIVDNVVCGSSFTQFNHDNRNVRWIYGNTKTQKIFSHFWKLRKALSKIDVNTKM